MGGKQTRLRLVDARFQRSQRRVNRRGISGGCLWLLGKEGGQSLTDIVEGRRTLGWRRGDALAHLADALVEVADGVGDAARAFCLRPAGTLPFDHLAGAFVGVLNVARELFDHGRNPLQRPGAGPLSVQALEVPFDFLEPAGEFRHSRARRVVHRTQALGQPVDRRAD